MDGLTPWEVRVADDEVEHEPEKASKPSKKARPGKAIELAEPDRWPFEVDGLVLADELRATVRRHVALSDEDADAITLWVVFAHAHDCFNVAPTLAATSPVKRCGKTTLLAVIARLVPR